MQDIVLVHGTKVMTNDETSNYQVTERIDPRGGRAFCISVPGKLVHSRYLTVKED